VLELTRLILRLMQSSLEPEIRNEAANEIAYQALNAARAREKLGWKPMFNLERAMGETIEWYTKFFSHSSHERGSAKQPAG
jgi:CDP-glucose 4,6-dehydratase